MYLLFFIEVDIVGVGLVTVLTLSILWIDGELNPVKGKSLRHILVIKTCEKKISQIATFGRVLFSILIV